MPQPRAQEQSQGRGAFLAATGRDPVSSFPGGDPEDTGGQRRYKRYQHDLIRPHVGRSLLEVGAGLGELAAEFHDLDRHVVTDLDPDCVRALAERFADRPQVTAAQIDVDGSIDLAESVDTVLAVNVLEHIADDVAALRGLARLAKPGGSLVLWVPGYQALYGEFDRRVGHHRRYTPSTLREVFIAAGFGPACVRPVNLLGGIAWWAAVRRGGARSPNRGLVDVYDRIVVPVTRVLDAAFVPPFGQSVLGVARVPRGDSGEQMGS